VKRRRVIVPSAGTVVAILVLAFWPGPKQPEYQGRKLSWWLKGDAGDRETFRAIQKIGTNGLPYLIHAVRYEPPFWAPYLPKIAYRLHLASERSDRAAQDALWGFRIMGRSAESAAPELGRILRSTKSCTCAVRVSRALIDIGNAGLDEIVAAIEEPGTRKKSCIIYYGMSNAEPCGDIRARVDLRRAVPALLRAMDHPDYGPFARERLVAESTENWMTLVPVLAACLRHTNESMRVASATVIYLNPNVTASVKMEADGILKDAPPKLVKRLAAN